jgi:hypothetical protein
MYFMRWNIDFLFVMRDFIGQDLACIVWKTNGNATSGLSTIQ